MQCLGAQVRIGAEIALSCAIAVAASLVAGVATYWYFGGAWDSLWIAAVVLGSSLAVGYVVSRALAAPLNRIVQAAEAFGRGETDVKLPVDAHGETGIVARALEKLKRESQECQDALEQRANELDLARQSALSLLHDVETARQELAAAHEELEQRARQIEQFNLDLCRSNEDLKQFAYVASHDLQEPLRKVTAFCQMLQNEYASQLDENAKIYIGYAVDGALRMKALIADLLAFSRIETQGSSLEFTDANQACRMAVDNLALAISEASAEVTCESLPEVLADGAQLARLFQNLIGNAIKYRGNEPPRVHVSAVERDDGWLFRVRDNGIGIEPQYHERIFVIFQRLHGRADYPGTGIGLAVCKRIVERAGGRIWVESAAGAGSGFCFTLSKPPLLDKFHEGDRSYARDIDHALAAIH